MRTKKEETSLKNHYYKVSSRKKNYKYVLVLIDIASRYKDAEPLTSKNSEEVASAFEKNYSRKLNYQNILIVDPGTDFFWKSNNIDAKTCC